jgi:uncharacterized membrane protein
MTREAHLWAVAYSEPARAETVREEVIAVSGKGNSMVLLDTAILACQADGSFTLDRKPLRGVDSFSNSTLSLLIGIALVGPLTGRAVDAMLGEASSSTSNSVGIDDDFVGEIKTLLKPATSALLLLDKEGNLDEILAAIRGLGGTVIKTNVDLERAKLIQSTLSQGASGI